MRDQVIAWDTCVLIDAIQKTEDRWGAIAPIINLAKFGDLKIVLSALSVAEAYYLKGLALTGASQAEQNAAIEGWLEHSFLAKRAADLGTCRIAAELCRQARGKLSPSDGVIIATALRHNATALLTYDGKQGESMLALDGRFPTANKRQNLRICRPADWTRDNSPQLFDINQEVAR